MLRCSSITHPSRVASVAAIVVCVWLGLVPSPARAATGATSTSVTLAVSPQNSGYGDLLALTATVTGADGGLPSGTVTFEDGDTTVGTATLNGATSDQAVLTTAVLAVGTHSLSAVYSGDTTYAAGASQPVHEPVGVMSTSLGVTTSATPAASGQHVTFTATVMPERPSASFSYTSDPGDGVGRGGSASFTAADSAITLHGGTSSLGVVINQGSSLYWFVDLRAPQGDAAIHPGTYTVPEFSSQAASMDVYGTGSVGCQTNGSFPVNAVDYGADGNIRGIDADFVQYCDGSTAALRGHVHVVGAAQPTGTVTFRDGGTIVATQTVGTPSQATYTTSSLSVGDHSISASYSGDASYVPSSSAALTQSVETASATVQLTISPAPALSGQAITLAATVTTTPSTARPTGQVSFDADGTPVASAPLDTTGHAAATVTMAGGVHSVTAVYSGDGIYPITTSSPVSEPVTSFDPTVGLSADLRPAQPGQSVTLRVTLSVPQGYRQPTGTVTFADGGAALGTSALDSGGHASMTVSSFDVGDHLLTATYNGDTTYPSTQSAGLPLAVRPPVSVGMASSSNPSVPGQGVAVAVVVASQDGGIPTGTVSFILQGGDGSNLGGPLDAAGDVIVHLPTTLATGTHTFSVIYSGDSRYEDSITSFTQTVAIADANRRFVNQLYNDILGRAADDGAAAWAAALDQQKITRTQVALALTSSTEYLTNQIDNAYLTHLGREADSGGLAFWLGYIRRGATFEDLEVSFLGTPEYYTNSGGTPDGFVSALYFDVFGRDVDSGGRDYWVARLNSGTPAWVVAASVVMSTEAMQNRVTADYELLLGRDPDPSGLAYWTGLLEHGTRDETLLGYLAGTAEYWNDCQAY